MNLFRLAGISALFLLAGSVTVSAQSEKTPGVLLGASNEVQMPSPLGTEAGTSNVLPRITIADVEDTHAKRIRLIWIASILTVVAGTAADSATSWHKRESNGFLASSDGLFGAKGVAIKGAFAAGVLVPQIIFRRHRDWYTAFAVGNFAETGIFAGAAIHNANTNSPAK
jgi:hypothetical protein